MLSIPDEHTPKIDIYSFSKTAYLNLGDKLKSDIFICNIAGQRVASRQSASGRVEVRLSNTGVYLVKVVTNESLVVKKVIIQ